MIQSPHAVNHLIALLRKSPSATVRAGKSLVALGLCGALIGWAQPAAAQTAADAQNASYIYQVTRSGDVIGEQRITIEHRGDDLIVSSDAKIDVKLLGLNLYGFDQHLEETWSQGKMIAVSSTADDDGDPKKVEMKLQGEQLTGTYNGKDRSAPFGIFPNTFWNMDSVKQTQILDTSRGKVRQVTITDKGSAAINLPYGKVNAHHYSMDGEMKRELWYDDKGVLVAGELIARDGSVVRQELLRAP